MVPVPPPGAGVTSGNTTGVTSTGRLVTFDREDPALDTAIAITGLQSGETVLGIDIRAGGATAGQLYALGSTGRVYTVDTTSGVATQKSVLAADAGDSTDAFTQLSGTEYGVDFDDATDRLRVVSDGGQNLRIDVDSGATTTDAALSRAGVNGAAYTNAFAAACRATAYYIDSTTDELLTTTDPNSGALTVVGPLGVDSTAVSDFEIATDAQGNAGYAVLIVGGVPTSYNVNLGTGAATAVGAVTRLDTDELVRDTAIAPSGTGPAQDPGDLYAITEGNKLLSFNSSLPGKVCTSATFSGQQTDEKIVGIDVRPADQALYALGSTGRLYTVDKSNAALTAHSTLVAQLGDLSTPYAGLTGATFGFDFNPGNDLVRAVSDSGLNFRVTPDDGVVTTDVALTPLGSIAGEAAYSNNFAGVNAASYYLIDSTSDSLQVVGRTSGNAINGDVLPVGALGVGDVQAVAGFDVWGSNNIGLTALNVAGNSSSDLYTVNLLNGSATRVGTIGGGERVNGLAYARTPVAVVYGLTSDGHLVSFKATTPGTLDSDVAITGLAGSEAIIGIDFRPSNGQLYALTDAGHLYVLDTTTGALSGSLTLTANPLDGTAPFAGLTGTRFGIDIGSADDVLRVQSDTGQNVRVNLADGTVITDGAPNLGGVPAQLFATAFNNPYAGALTSTHYALDLASNSLVRQTSLTGALASNGVLTVGGAPGAFQLEGGFDIAGGENGLAAVALLPVGATGSTFYRVTLGNGALTSLGAIGAGSTVIRDIAVHLE